MLNAENIFAFPDCRSLVVCGDIHGDFNLLVNKICVQYQMTDTVVIVAGDCSFGFERKGYYDDIVKRNSKRMNNANNWIVFVRGNHDNPAYFDGRTFAHKRFIAVPDYAVIKACGHEVLCIGGAISLDRSYRIEAWQQQQKKLAMVGHEHDDTDLLAPNNYWDNEAPRIEKVVLANILASHQIDTVVTHTAPSFCELITKTNMMAWAENDKNLIQDIQHERSVMDEIYNTQKDHSITHWCYGHFHQSWHSTIDGIFFKMLDIMELYEIK
jgi:predicted phosphodiesterase